MTERELLVDFFTKHCEEYHPDWITYDVEKDVDDYLKSINSQPNGGDRVVNENEPQKEVCICGFPHAQVRSDKIRYCIGCGKPKQTD